MLIEYPNLLQFAGLIDKELIAHRKNLVKVLKVIPERDSNLSGV